ncbi:MAG: aromatic ring-hydroxylating dioxygenase subunit alpha, partial [Pseudomonadota bacterium]
RSSRSEPAGRGSRWYSYQTLLDHERNPVPDALREDTQPELEPAPLSAERYTSQEFFDLEVEKVWKKTWQMACRVSQLRRPGDHYVYDIAHLSILIVRTDDDELKAYYNSCLHRGRRLAERPGRFDGAIVCPFHGFRWELNGKFRGTPCPWDFKHLDRNSLSLPEVRVDTWGGWVFVNMDPDCGSLADQLGILPAHFERYDPENRYVTMHVEKIVRCNWKVALEAFVESFHAWVTHPQIMSYQGIDNSQYDIWGDNVSRSITPLGVINPGHIDELTIQDTLNEVMRHPPELDGVSRSPTLDEQLTARRLLADHARESYRRETGKDLSATATDAEMVDAILYLAFPNFAPWVSYAPTFTYRHRPYGRHVDLCVMDIYMLAEMPEGVARLADTKTVRLGPDDKFTDTRAMPPRLAEIFEQDNRNMPEVQRGMETSLTGTLQYAAYQEVRIRHFHRTLDKYLNA